MNCSGFIAENVSGESFAASFGLKLLNEFAGTLSIFHPVSAPASALALPVFAGAAFAAGFNAACGRALRCSGLIDAITAGVKDLNWLGLITDNAPFGIASICVGVNAPIAAAGIALN